VWSLDPGQFPKVTSGCGQGLFVILLTGVNSILPNEQYRTGTVTHNLVSYAANDQTGQTAESKRRHNNEINSLSYGGVDDAFSRQNFSQ
jgi:hypothetical protein